MFVYIYIYYYTLFLFTHIQPNDSIYDNVFVSASPDFSTVSRRRVRHLGNEAEAVRLRVVDV